MPIRAWDPSPYPDARQRKAFGATSGAAIEVSIPRTKRWAFHVEASGDGQVRTAVSLRFVGPVLLKAMLIDATPLNNATLISVMSLRWAADGSGAGAQGADGAFPAGTPLFEWSYSSSVAIEPSRPDTYFRTQSNTTHKYAGPILLDEYIDAPSIFLKATIHNQGAGAGIYSGMLTLYEGVDPEIALDLMG